MKRGITGYALTGMTRPKERLNRKSKNTRESVEHSYPMRQKELTRWVERLANTAAGVFARDGGCPTTALLVVNRVPMAFEAPLGSGDDRAALRALFEVGARGGAEACALVAEAWAAGGSAKTLAKAIARRQRGKSLADIPGRKELLLVHAVSAIGSAGLQYAIERVRSGIRLTDRKPLDEPLFNRFLSNLPWGGHASPTTTCLEEIVAALRRIVEAKGTHNFVICHADERKNYFVQFATGRSDTVVRAEAVSNKFLEPTFKLTDRQMKALRSMGWKPPKPKESPSFYRDWEKRAEDRLLMAEHAMRTLVDIYGVRPDQKLKVEVGLEKGND